MSTDVIDLAAHRRERTEAQRARRRRQAARLSEVVVHLSPKQLDRVARFLRTDLGLGMPLEAGPFEGGPS